MTRYYPSTKAPFGHPHAPLYGTWGVMGGNSPVSPVRERYVLQRIKEPVRTGDQFDQVKIFMTTNQQPNYDYAPDWVWVTRPLQAQTLSGAFNFCFQMCVTFLNYTPPGSAFFGTIARPKIHMYLVDGTTFKWKANILDNVVIPLDIPREPFPQWISMPLGLGILPSVTVATGDRLVIEFGFRIISSFVSTVVNPPLEWNRVTLGYLKTNEQFPDAVPADGINTGRAPWIEFSDDILEIETATLPTNDSCSTAINIPSLPYTSDFLDSTFSSDSSNGLWWKYTATENGRVTFFLHGSNINASIQIYTGVCGFLSLANNDGARIADDRSYAVTSKGDLVQGTTYFIKIADDTLGFRGGRVRLNALRPESPKADDIILAANSLFVLRDGAYVNVSNVLADHPPTGLAIDYTGRPMKSLRDHSFHTFPRLHVGLHDTEVVVIIDVATLSEGGAGIDWIGNIANWWQPSVSVHMGQLYITVQGRLYVAWFGDGYNFIGGRAIVDHISTAMLNSPSSHFDYPTIKSIDATHGENQDNSPYPARRHSIATTLSSWAFTLDETNGILYYVTGGMYIPVGTHQTIKRYDIVNGVQLTDFVTITAGGPVPGLKGLRLLATGGLLVCNGNVVNRVSAGGVVTGTYFPSIPEDSTCLVDLTLSVDQTKFWVVDLYSTRIFKFDVITGVELMNFQPYGTSGSVVQMITYNPPPVIPLPDMSGLYYVKTDAKYDTYNTIVRKIPNPTVKTAFLGE